MGLAHAEVLFVVAEAGSCADAARGGLPKPTDDSLTDFLQASPDRSKRGSAHAKQLSSQPPSQRGDGPEGRGECRR